MSVGCQGRSCRRPDLSIAIAIELTQIHTGWMSDHRHPPREFAFPSGDDASNARWLAGLIQALRRRVDGARHPEVSAILNEAQRAAEAAAKRGGARKAH